MAEHEIDASVVKAASERAAELAKIKQRMIVDANQGKEWAFPFFAKSFYDYVARQLVLALDLESQGFRTLTLLSPRASFPRI